MGSYMGMVPVWLTWCKINLYILFWFNNATHIGITVRVERVGKMVNCVVFFPNPCLLK